MNKKTVRVCAVSTCSSPSGVKYFAFPRKNLVTQRLWISKCKRANPINPIHAKICEIHFTPADFQRDLESELLHLNRRQKLKPGAFPSLELSFASSSLEQSSSSRKDRMEIRKRKELVDKLLREKNVIPESLAAEPMTENEELMTENEESSKSCSGETNSKEKISSSKAGIRTDKSRKVCAVSTCKSPKHLSYHRFPKDSQRRKEWILACSRGEPFNADEARICASHFTPSCFKRDLRNELLGTPAKHLLEPDAVPTRYLKKEYNLSDEERSQRAAKRRLPFLDVDELLRSFTEPTDIAELHEPALKSMPLSESGTQCDLIGPKSKLVLENAYFKKKLSAAREEISSLRKKNHYLQSKKHELLIVKKHLARKCEPSLTKRILSDKSIRCNRGYTKDEIISALVLRYMSNRAFEYLRKNNTLALPSRQTQEKWLKRFDISFGLQDVGIKAFKARLQTPQNDALLTFAEMELKGKVETDSKKGGQTSGSCYKLLVVILRGLSQEWKQPIFFDLDISMTQELLFFVIEELEHQGFRIRGISTDMGTLHPLLTQLSCHDQPEYSSSSFPNPFDPSRHVHVFPDSRHLLKSARDHLLDKGLVIYSKDGSCFTDFVKSDLAKLQRDPQNPQKISEQYLNCNGTIKQRIEYATQLFSKATAKALGSSLSHTMNEKEIRLKESLVLTFDAWFQALNPNESQRHWGAEGAVALDEMEMLLRSLKMKNKAKDGFLKKPPLWQKGMLMSIQSLRALHSDLVINGSHQHIMTEILSHDCVEDFFSQFRSISSESPHTSALEIKSRLKILLLLDKNGPFLELLSDSSSFHLKEESNAKSLPSSSSSTSKTTQHIDESSSVVKLEEEGNTDDIMDPLLDLLEVTK